VFFKEKELAMNSLFIMYLDSFTNIVLIVSLSLVLLVIIGILVFLVTKKIRKRKNTLKENLYNLDDIYTALGGRNNIISHQINGTRLTLVLRDYKKVDREKLRSFGVERVLLMSNKYILVGEHLDKINEKLN